MGLLDPDNADAEAAANIFSELSHAKESDMPYEPF
jgi:hypothetical protein